MQGPVDKSLPLGAWLYAPWELGCMHPGSLAVCVSIKKLCVFNVLALFFGAGH